ncbi:hypothetical protein E4T48_01436 [Aureobasidium sp. EXF-10727]|nr:hypothetical protein E4T48_01436 [Aureobasidium sp. EXF-10727]
MCTINQTSDTLEETPVDESESISDQWFDGMIQKPANQNFHHEINAVRAYHHGRSSASEAACAMTRPLTYSPLPRKGTESPSFALMFLLAEFLDEWPLSRSREFITLLRAFEHLVDGPHGGQYEAEDDGPTLWKDLPWLRSIWRNDICWESPDLITKRCAKTPAIQEHEFEIYIKRQDISAQLTAAGILEIKHAYYLIAWALEYDHESDDLGKRRRPHMPFIPDWHIPSIARYIIVNGKRFYEDAINQNMQGCFKIPPYKYDRMCKERWDFWKERLTEFADGAEGVNEVTKGEAKAAVQHMESVVDAWESSHNSTAMT